MRGFQFDSERIRGWEGMKRVAAVVAGVMFALSGSVIASALRLPRALVLRWRAMAQVALEQVALAQALCADRPCQLPRYARS